jgi:putative effector of murein hydrolase
MEKVNAFLKLKGYARINQKGGAMEAFPSIPFSLGGIVLVLPVPLLSPLTH